MINVFISGQGYFAEQVLRAYLNNGINITGVCCPVGDKYIGKLANTFNIPVIHNLNAEALNNLNKTIDLGICAHSFDYVGKLTRYKPKHGWIGYHPSLLPRHRGRSSIEWALRIKDIITGGTVFWLNAGIDRGDIAYQDWFFIDPKLFYLNPKEAARILWQDKLQEIGIRLLLKAVKDIEAGIYIRTPQDNRFSTWEPSTEVKDIYRPDALMIE